MFIRKMIEADMPAVLDIELQCFGKRDVENLEKCFNDTNYCYLVADNGGIVIGYIAFMIVGDDAEVVILGVDSMYRHMGVGFALSKAMITELKRLKKNSIFLEVRKSNVVAMALYSKLGFNAINVRKKYYDGVEDAVIMKCDIK